jgi:arabinofuranosyltransferase
MDLSLSRLSISTIVFVTISAIALVFAIQTIATFPRWVVDDAFITFRYAENLATKGELNWNVGENPTEGYTGIALPLVLSLAIKLGISPITGTHVIGIFSYFCGGLLLLLILRGFNLGSSIALLLYFTQPHLFAHAWSGLETMMFLASLLLVIYAFTLRRNWFFLLSILLVSSTRPEGTLFGVVMLAFYRPFSLKVVLLYAVPCGIYFLWRWRYYGQLLPNTFYAKSTANTQLLLYNRHSLQLFLYSCVLKPTALALLFVAWVDRRRLAWWMAAVATFSFVVVLFYLKSKLVMDYSYRFFVPFYPFLLLALASSLNSTKTNLKFLPAILVLTVPQVDYNLREITPQIRNYSCYRELMQSEHISIGKYLRRTVPADERLIVYADGGAIPYYSRLRTVDFGVLNDEYLAKARPDLAAMTEYFYSVNAGVLVVTSSRSDRLERSPEIEHIARDPRFDQYSLVKVFRSRCRDDYYEFVYFRKDVLDSLGSGKSYKPGN